MGYREIDIKPSYNSDHDDILGSFYVPVLSEARKYDRIAGFFSSSALACAAKGIVKMIQNRGKMRLVTSAKLSQRDAEALKQAVEDPQEILERAALFDLDELKDGIMKDHARAMAWMYAKGLLDIRIAIVYDNDGKPIDSIQLVRDGILHQKIGLFEDAHGEKISFSGSINESRTAWESNLEQFKVYKEWIPSQRGYYEADRSGFDRLWDDRSKRARIFDIPQATKMDIISTAPDSIGDLNLGYIELDRRVTVGKKNEVALWPHQMDAMEKWLVNKRGIFEMATASGKTLAALACVQNVSLETKPLVVVVSTPYNHLSMQWLNEVTRLGMDFETLIVDSTNRDWPLELAALNRNLKMGLIDKAILFTTHNTLHSEKLIEALERFDAATMLIADEVHSAGSPVRRKGLVDGYRYRLGLSATPSRHLDDEGTNFLLNYFGGVVKKFDLENAVKTMNPDTGQTYLCPYEYHPIPVTLTSEEFTRYMKETWKIRRAFYAAEKEADIRSYFELLCIKRQDIVKNAENKIPALEELIVKLDSRGLLYCLIYANPEQISDVQDLLLRLDIKQHKFTEKEGTKSEKKYGGKSEREYLLRQLADAMIQALVSMKCLDEGVDVPPARIGIVVASSGNPRQYIQRRGRLLRRHLGKEKAEIYDFIVVPQSTNLDDIEKTILIRESRRYLEFAELALNDSDCIGALRELCEKYGLELTEIEERED